MNKPKYPMSLFIIGVLMNFVMRHLLLFLGGLILILVCEPGTFFHYVGIVMLVFDFLLSLGLQMGIRKEVMSESDNPEIQRLQAALSKEGRWTDNVKDIVEDKVEEYEEKLEKKKSQNSDFEKSFDPDDETIEELEEEIIEIEEANDESDDDEKPHQKKVIYEDQEDDVDEETDEEADDEDTDSERDK